MEFEQYLERDIITFLEGKIEKKENVLIDREEEYGVYMSKDYLKELSYALDNEELTKAKRLFDELKAKFSRIPKNSLERKKVYSVLEKMYDKIQNYVKIKAGEIEVIKEGDSEIFKDTTDKFTDMSSRILTNKIKIPVEYTIDVENVKPMELPIRFEKDKEKNPSKDSKVNDKNKINISGDSKESKPEGNKIDIEENRHDKKHPDKTKDDATRHPNILIKEMDNSKRGNLSKDSWYDDHTTQMDDIEPSIALEIAHVTQRILNELRRKLEEKNDEQDRKIEAIRTEITTQLIDELNKKCSGENTRHDVAPDKIVRITNIRENVLDKVFRKAPYIVTGEDNKLNRSTDNIERVTYTIEDINKSDLKHKHNNEDIRKMYEEAIYTMFQSNYDEAAKIFRDIIKIRPTNKAAKIRLQECIEAIGNA